MSEIQRYPLAWPTFWKRTPADQRQSSDFSQKGTRTYREYDHTVRGMVDRTKVATVKVTMRTACERLWDQLGRLGVDEGRAGGDTILSSNVEPTVYGEPKGGRREPDDVGVAVYFKFNGKPRVLACDRWRTVAENIAAIAAHIDALRRVERYGVGTLDQAFTAYDALPAPGAINKPHWRKVFKFADTEHVTEKLIRDRYTVLAKDCHPDKSSGSNEAMAVLNVARDEALTEVAAYHG